MLPTMTALHTAADRLHTLLHDDQNLRTLLREHAARGDDRRFDLPPLQSGAANTETLACVATAQEAANAWAAAQPVQGWVLHQSAQAAFDAAHPLPDSRDWGALLDAEGVDAQGRSLRLARNAEGLWVLTRTTHDPNGPGVYDEVHHLASAAAFGALRYRRYWGLDSEGLIAVRSAHFIGYFPTV